MTTSQILLLFTCEIVLLVFFAYSAWTMVVSVPFYPSRTKKLKDAIHESGIKLSGNFVDIGSGDGRIARWASSNGMNAQGIEVNPFLTLFARAYNIVGKQKVTYFNTRYQTINFKQFNVVYVYLFPHMMLPLESKLWEELEKDSIIITNTFTFPNKKPFKTINKINFYKV